jgi:thiol-disulfide isomerase/thioredoxin
MKDALLAALLALLLAGPLHANELAPWKGGATPPLVLKDAAGMAHDLAQYRGKVVLVNFWATWCEPCRAEMPSMQRLRERLAGRPFAVLAVNYMESDEKVSAFLASERIELTAPMDKDGASAKRWKVKILPASFVVDARGRIRYSLTGEANWDDPGFASAIERLFEPDPKSTRADAAR